jgi:hypothetical protein
MRVATRLPVLMAINDFGDHQYDGPQPPPGRSGHHYHFRLLTLDVPARKLPTRAKTVEVVEAAKPHTLAEAEVAALVRSPVRKGLSKESHGFQRHQRGDSFPASRHASGQALDTSAAYVVVEKRRNRWSQGVNSSWRVRCRRSGDRWREALGAHQFPGV